MIDIQLLMRLLGYKDHEYRVKFSYTGKQGPGLYDVDLDKNRGFWLNDDCNVDETGIRAKKIDDHCFNLLTDVEQQFRSDFENNIYLELPCSIEGVKAWAKKNDFKLDKAELRKIKAQNQKTQIKVNCKFGTFE